MNKQKQFKGWAGALLLIIANSGRAEVVQAIFNVSATIQSQCSVTATDLNFGFYYSDFTSYSTSTINVTCAPKTSYQVGLSPGNSGEFQKRIMKGPAALNYQIFRPVDGTLNQKSETLWGPLGGEKEFYYLGTADGSTQALIAYGEIPAGQSGLPDGSYSDTIVVSVDLAP